MRLAAAAFSLICALPLDSVALAETVGVRILSIPAPERDEPLIVTVWYPAEEGGTLVMIGENGVFRGAPAHRDAPSAGGAFPVVLISHGGMRAAPNQASWLEKALAEQGYLVVDVRAAPLESDQAALAPAEIWKRPADLSTALTALEEDPVFAGRLDASRVGAVGFFLGGTAVLQLAGAQLDAAAYVRSCDAPKKGPDCGWFKTAGVDLHAVDPEQIARSNADPRIGAVIAVEPELTGALSAESLSQLAASVDIIGLGHAIALPNVPSETIDDATSFSAFNLCKPKGAAILEESGGDPTLCLSDAGVGRERLHAELAKMIAELLGERLQTAH